jgi:hypothetical protein
MPPIRKIEEFTAKPPRRVQIDTKQNPLQIVDNARLFRQTRGLNRTAVTLHTRFLGNYSPTASQATHARTWRIVVDNIRLFILNGQALRAAKIPTGLFESS